MGVTAAAAAGFAHGQGSAAAAAAVSAVAATRYVNMGGSSPDLVSRRNLHNSNLNRGVGTAGFLHKTLDNLDRVGGGGGVVGKDDLRKVNGDNYVSYGRAISCNEPIYQNQQQVQQQQQQQQSSPEEEEPIYQNLPVHERALYKQRLLEQQQQQQQHSAKASTNKLRGHVSRVAITNSRENLSLAAAAAAAASAAGAAGGDNDGNGPNLNFVYEEGGVIHGGGGEGESAAKLPSTSSRSVTKISIGESKEEKRAADDGGGDHDEVDEAKREVPTGIRSEDEGGEEEKGRGEGVERKRPMEEGEEVEEEERVKSHTLSHPPKQQQQQQHQHQHQHLHHWNEQELVPVAAIAAASPRAAAPRTTPRTPSSKPRAGRKRWALNFGSKTGSLKSVVGRGRGSGGGSGDGSGRGGGGGDSGGDLSRDGFGEQGVGGVGGGSGSSKNSSGFGPLMLATLHGLTRSRPDLLSESLSSPSLLALSAGPSRLPKEEVGEHLRAKLAGGEVLREFERVPRRRPVAATSRGRGSRGGSGGGGGNEFRTATLAENLPRSRFRDVLPYEENRVRLSGVDKDNRTGFVNASHVSATVGQEQVRFWYCCHDVGPCFHTVSSSSMYVQFQDLIFFPLIW